MKAWPSFTFKVLPLVSFHTISIVFLTSTHTQPIPISTTLLNKNSSSEIPQVSGEEAMVQFDPELQH